MKMERLTHYDEDCRVWSSRGYEIALARLAAYEDILFDADGNEVVTLDHLRELVQAEKDGRMTIVEKKSQKDEFVEGITASSCTGCHIQRYCAQNPRRGYVSCADIARQYYDEHFTTAAEAALEKGEARE